MFLKKRNKQNKTTKNEFPRRESNRKPMEGKDSAISITPRQVTVHLNVECGRCLKLVELYL